MSDPICHDHGPHPIREPHGSWWLTVRVPLPGGRHFYLGTGTARRWRWWRFEWWTVQTPWITVVLSPREHPLDFNLFRWCAHIKVTYTDRTEEREVAK